MAIARPKKNEATAPDDVEEYAWISFAAAHVAKGMDAAHAADAADWLLDLFRQRKQAAEDNRPHEPATSARDGMDENP